MKITLLDEDVRKAVIAYVGSQGFNVTDFNCEVTFTKARKTALLTADVEMTVKEKTSLSNEPLDFRANEA